MLSISVCCGIYSKPTRRATAVSPSVERGEIRAADLRTITAPAVRALPMRSPAAALLVASLLGGSARAAGEEPRPWSLDLTVHDFGIGIGNSRHIDGLRLNFRDTAPFSAHGVNATIWMPSKEAGDSEVDGLALGLPLTGAGRVRGVALGLGAGADKTLDGIGVGILGVGSGGGLRGVHLGGLGAGTGGDVIGIAAGGLGVGAGGSVYGMIVGGLGAGAGGDFTGIGVGGLGVGAGGRLRGIAVGGLGAGAGQGVQGIALGGLGAGSGGDVQGLIAGGLGAGAGGTIQGVAIGGLGVGAPRIQGLAVGLAAGGKEVQGVVVAPAYFHVVENGSFTGLSVSAFNRVLGEQRGLAIGLVNYASRLNGVQIGLVNWADNNPSGLKVLPVANAHFD
jgi:hypothetical protein